jgi:hypothetical protein
MPSKDSPFSAAPPPQRARAPSVVNTLSKGSPFAGSAAEAPPAAPVARAPPKANKLDPLNPFSGADVPPPAPAPRPMRANEQSTKEAPVRKASVKAPPSQNPLAPAAEAPAAAPRASVKTFAAAARTTVPLGKAAEAPAPEAKKPPRPGSRPGYGTWTPSKDAPWSAVADSGELTSARREARANKTSVPNPLVPEPAEPAAATPRREVKANKVSAHSPWSTEPVRPPTRQARVHEESGVGAALLAAGGGTAPPPPKHQPKPVPPSAAQHFSVYSSVN